MSVPSLRVFLLAGTAALSAASVQAQTSGTVAGTTISNTAQASYTVNGTAQAATSNTATFVVDRKVNLTVINNASANTSVNLGDSNVVTSFKVTNNTNGTQDFRLAASQQVATGVLGGTDDFDLANLRIFVDANANGTYEAGTDLATFIDELAPDAQATVFVVGDVPSNPNDDLAQIGLDVIAAAGGSVGIEGAALVATPLGTGNQDASVDIVFADADSDGVLGFDAARNGRGWAYGAYEITTRSVALSVTKSASIVSDGVNGSNPRAIPGAVVQYCLTVQNATLGTAASNVSLTDVVPTGTTYVPGSIQLGSIGGGGVCNLTGTPIADDGSSTGFYTGSFNGTSKTVTATIASVPGGASIAASFRVTIN